jgi:hypothetical protein
LFIAVLQKKTRLNKENSSSSSERKFYRTSKKRGKTLLVGGIESLGLVFSSVVFMEEFS